MKSTESRAASGWRRSTLVLLAALASPLACTSERAPSVILITIDTLRADHLSSYGYARSTSPALDRFMERGVRYAWAFSASASTTPSHASIFTGRYPSFHSVGLLNGTFRLGDDEVTLAELLQQHGLTTAAVISNPVLDRSFGFDQGFEIYEDEFPDWEQNRDVAEQIAEHAVNKALAILDRVGDRPFFLWLHLQDPHGPYTPPESLSTEWDPAGAVQPDPLLPIGGDDIGFRAIPSYQVIRDEQRFGDYVQRYDAEIRGMDDQLARFLERVDRMGLLDDGLVAITADHGEAMGEEEFFFAHSHSVGLDQVHVPLAFVGAGAAPGSVIDDPASNVDVFPTILSFLGVEIPEGTQSFDLLPANRDGAIGERPPVFTENVAQVGVAHPGAYLRLNRFSGPLAQDPPAPGATDWREVRFGEDLVSLGSADVSARRVSWQRQLRVFQQFADATQQTIGQTRQEVGLTEDEKARLRSLGYAR